MTNIDPLFSIKRAVLKHVQDSFKLSDDIVNSLQSSSSSEERSIKQLVDQYISAASIDNNIKQQSTRSVRDVLVYTLMNTAQHIKYDFLHSPSPSSKSSDSGERRFNTWFIETISAILDNIDFQQQATLVRK